VNWLMARAPRRVGAGRVGLRTMASVEPWTVRDYGFIDLLASGEMCEGDTIHDRPHLHARVAHHPRRVLVQGRRRCNAG
jgi:hypothetical protein